MLPVLNLLSVLPAFERELRLLPLLVRAGQTCVDVGASYGAYAIPLALLVGGAGRVLAFEPRRDAAARLARVAKTLRLRSLDVAPLALGAVIGTDTLVVPHRQRRAVAGRSYLSAGAVQAALDDGLSVGGRLAVDVSTLDSVRADLRSPIDFIKCDVEGSELEVFTGARRVLEADRPTILCEIEDRHAARYGRCASSVFEFLEKWDYVVVATARGPIGRNHLFLPAERASSLAGDH